MLDKEGRLRPEVIEGFKNICYIQKAYDANFHCIMLDSINALNSLMMCIKANITQLKSPDSNTVILFCTTYNLHICRMSISKHHSDIQIVIPCVNSPKIQSDIGEGLRMIRGLKKYIRCSESIAVNEVQLFTGILRVHYKSKSCPFIAPLFKPLLSRACTLTIDDIYKEYDKEWLDQRSAELNYNPANISITEPVIML